MDILIFNPRMMMISSSLMSSGPITIASYIKQKGIDVKLIDDNSQYRKYKASQLTELIRHEKPLYIAIGLNVLNAFNGYSLLKYIRSNFNDLIIIGGGLYSYDMAREMAQEGFDIVVKGEAEISLVSLLKALMKNNLVNRHELFGNESIFYEINTIPGLLFKKNNDIIDTGETRILLDLDQIGFLDHSVANLNDFIRNKYDHYGVTNTLNFQRGCPFRCIYCKAHFMENLRHNSATFMHGQLVDLYDRYGLDQFNISDANFPLDKNRMHKFCNLMISSGLSKSIKLWCQTSVSIPLANEEIELLSDAGFTMISIGVERFDTRFRKYMNKAGTAEQAIELLGKIKEKKIKTNINSLINFPIETEETIEREALYMEKALPAVDYCGINYLVPLPGTNIYDSSSNKKWYLNQRIVTKIVSYYDLAFNITTPGLEFNLFNLSSNVVIALRRFKENYYKKSISQINKSKIFKLLLAADLFVGKISYSIYRFSPSIEDFIFKPLKYFRIIGAKMIMNKYIMKKKRQPSISQK